MKTPETLEFPSLSYHDPDWIPLLHEARKLLGGRMERYVCKALPRRTVEEAQMSGEIGFYLKEAMGGDVSFITYMQSKGYPYVENEYATDLRVMWIEEILYFCELAKKMIEIKLDGLKVAIKEGTDGYVASVEFTKVDSQQLVGDSEVELLNDVIEIIQQHYESTVYQIRLIKKLRMQKG